MSSLRGSLDARGRAIVDLSVSASEPLRRRLAVTGREAPTINVRALIDTGASDLVLDLNVVSKLRLSPTDTRIVHTASSGPGGVHTDAYEVRASLTSAPSLWNSGLEPAVVHDLGTLGVGALIGRRQLRELVFTFDGPHGSFTLRKGRGLIGWMRG